MAARTETHTVALQNRVNPWGMIEAVDTIGTWMGNRGIIHDDDRTVVRPQRSLAWIICQLEFRGRHRSIMSPGTYTELFFLDEATALAAGHRPCFECRRGDAEAFRAAWRRRGGRADASVRDIDRELAEQRRVPRTGMNEGKRAYAARAADLPPGAMIELDGVAWLVHDGRLVAWTPHGYGDSRRREIADDLVGWVLTPYGTVRTLANGYRPQPHASLG